MSAQSRVRHFWTNFEVPPLPQEDGPQLLDALIPFAQVKQRLEEVQMSARFVQMYNKHMNERPRGNVRNVVFVRDDSGMRVWRENNVGIAPRTRWMKYPLSDSHKPKSGTITTNHPNHHLIDRRVVADDPTLFIVRKFFADELEPLFGFPPRWTANAHLTENQRINVLGNSIVVPVLEHILTALKTTLDLCRDNEP